LTIFYLSQATKKKVEKARSNAYILKSIFIRQIRILYL